MIANVHLRVLERIADRLHASPVAWAVTGSLGMALQGVPVTVHDIDIQTDEKGVYEIERQLAFTCQGPAAQAVGRMWRSADPGLVAGIRVPGVP